MQAEEVAQKLADSISEQVVDDLSGICAPPPTQQSGYTEASPPSKPPQGIDRLYQEIQHPIGIRPDMEAVNSPQELQSQQDDTTTATGLTSNPGLSSSSNPVATRPPENSNSTREPQEDKQSQRPFVVSTLAIDTSAESEGENGAAAAACGYFTGESRQTLWQSLRSTIPENKFCFDCGARNAPWVSVSFAIFLCLTCSGHHRNLGPKVSFVRSCDLDNIKFEEGLRMECGGNRRAKTFFRNHGLMVGESRLDYRSKPAERYRKLLDREVQELMEELHPEWVRREGAGGESDTNVRQGPPVEVAMEDDFDAAFAEAAARTSPQTVKIAPASVNVVYAANCGAGTGIDAGSGVPVRDAEELDFDFDSAFETSLEKQQQEKTAKKGLGGLKNGGAAAARTAQGRTNEEVLSTAAAGGLKPGPVNSNDEWLKRIIAEGKEGGDRLPVKDLSQAKSISAEDYRAAQNAAAGISNPDDAKFLNTLAQYRDADAIGSDAFRRGNNNPGNADSRQDNWDDDLGARIAIVRETAFQTASELAHAAQSTFKSAAEWLSRVTDPY